MVSNRSTNLHAAMALTLALWPWNCTGTLIFSRRISTPKTKLLGEAIRNVSLNRYEINSQGQRSRSNITNFQSLLAFIVGHVPTKLHRFPTSSFWNFAWGVSRTHRHCQKHLVDQQFNKDVGRVNLQALAEWESLAVHWHWRFALTQCQLHHRSLPSWLCLQRHAGRAETGMLHML